MTKAVTAHRKTAHPELDVKSWLKLMVRQRFLGVNKREKLKKAVIKRHDQVRRKNFQDAQAH